MVKISPAVVTLSPTNAITLGPQVVGTTSVPQTATLGSWCSLNLWLEKSARDVPVSFNLQSFRWNHVQKIYNNTYVQYESGYV